MTKGEPDVARSHADAAAAADADGGGLGMMEGASNRLRSRPVKNGRITVGPELEQTTNAPLKNLVGSQPHCIANLIGIQIHWSAEAKPEFIKPNLSTHLDYAGLPFARYTHRRNRIVTNLTVSQIGYTFPQPHNSPTPLGMLINKNFYIRKAAKFNRRY